MDYTSGWHHVMLAALVVLAVALGLTCIAVVLLAAT